MTQEQLLLHVSDAAATALRQAKSDLFTDANREFLTPLSEAELNKVVAAAVSAVVVTANNVASTSRFKPPDDVSCSMAILTWQETSDIFGRRVANTYIAIQVTVRNLNKTNEFLIHDIQAVDTGLNPADFSRFQAGRDKLLVRAVAERGQTQDRRNLALNSLLAVGAIASAVTPLAPATEFATGILRKPCTRRRRRVECLTLWDVCPQNLVASVMAISLMRESSSAWPQARGAPWESNLQP
jgi:hypothetical protein